MVPERKTMFFKFSEKILCHTCRSNLSFRNLLMVIGKQSLTDLKRKGEDG